MDNLHDESERPTKTHPFQLKLNRKSPYFDKKISTPCVFLETEKKIVLKQRRVQA